MRFSEHAASSPPLYGGVRGGRDVEEKDLGTSFSIFIISRNPSLLTLFLFRHWAWSFSFGKRTQNH